MLFKPKSSPSHTNERNMSRIIKLALLPCLLTTSLEASAEDALEEVMVTAELRDEPLLRQAASTSVVDAGQIRQRAADHLGDILGLLPNVNFAGGSSRARFYQVRGVGERSQFVEPLNPSVGLIIDDIDLSGLGTAGGLFDIEQVEVLRGPQGTLHGANALAGLINIRSAAPENVFRGYVDASLAEYDKAMAATGEPGRTTQRRERSPKRAHPPAPSGRGNDDGPTRS